MSVTSEERLAMAAFQSGCLGCGCEFQADDDTVAVAGLLLHTACLTDDDELFLERRRMSDVAGMKKVETLNEVDKGGVWRSAEGTISWVDGEWCQLNGREWLTMQSPPTGPFFRIDNPVFSDYRDNLHSNRSKPT